MRNALLRFLLAACLSSLAHANPLVDQATQIKDDVLNKTQTPLNLVPQVLSGDGAPKPGDQDRAFKALEAARFADLGRVEIDNRNNAIIAEIAKLKANPTIPNLIAAGLLTGELTAKKGASDTQKDAFASSYSSGMGQYQLLTLNAEPGAQLPGPKPPLGFTANTSANATTVPKATADDLNEDLRANLESLGVDADEYANLMAQGRVADANFLVAGVVPEPDTSGLSNSGSGPNSADSIQAQAEAIAEAAQERIAEATQNARGSLSGNDGLTVTHVGAGTSQSQGEGSASGSNGEIGRQLTKGISSSENSGGLNNKRDDAASFRRKYALRKGRSEEDYEAELALQETLKKQGKANNQAMLGLIRNHILLPHATSNIFTIAHKQYQASRKRRRFALN